jgi:hypothetical protein
LAQPKSTAVGHLENPQQFLALPRVRQRFRPGDACPFSDGVEGAGQDDRSLGELIGGQGRIEQDLLKYAAKICSQASCRLTLRRRPATLPPSKLPSR